MKMKISSYGTPPLPSPKKENFRGMLMQTLPELQVGSVLEISVDDRSLTSMRNQISEVVRILRAKIPGYSLVTRIVYNEDGPAIMAWRIKDTPSKDGPAIMTWGISEKRSVKKKFPAPIKHFLALFEITDPKRPISLEQVRAELPKRLAAYKSLTSPQSKANTKMHILQFLNPDNDNEFVQFLDSDKKTFVINVDL